MSRPSEGARHGVGLATSRSGSSISSKISSRDSGSRRSSRTTTPRSAITRTRPQRSPRASPRWTSALTPSGVSTTALGEVGVRSRWTSRTMWSRTSCSSRTVRWRSAGQGSGPSGPGPPRKGSRSPIRESSFGVLRGSDSTSAATPGRAAAEARDSSRSEDRSSGTPGSAPPTASLKGSSGQPTTTLKNPVIVQARTNCLMERLCIGSNDSLPSGGPNRRRRRTLGVAGP